MRFFLPLSTYQKLEYQSFLDVVMAIDGWSQTFGKKFQHIIAFGDFSNVLDVDWRHLDTGQTAMGHQW